MTYFDDGEHVFLMIPCIPDDSILDVEEDAW